MQAEAERPATGAIAFILDLKTTPTSWAAKAFACSMLLLPIAYVEPVLLPGWSSRMIVALLVTPLGVSQLVVNVLERDRPTIWLTGLMTTCTVATLIGDVPLWNIRGSFGRDSSLTFLVILASFWAGARSLDRPGRRLAVVASLFGAAISCTAALIQVIVAPTTGIYALIGSRPGGLLDNPVALGAIAAGAASLAATAWSRGSTPPSLGFGAVALFTACVSLSGSRGALIGVTVGLVVGLVSSDLRTRVILAVSVGTGWVSAIALTNINDGRDVMARASLENGGRSSVWNYAMQAIADKPLFGHGFGQFRSATQPYFEPGFVRRYASHPIRGGWPDAHNVVIQYAVVGGLVSATFLGLFVWSSLRDARGPMVWAASAVALTWLLQPVTLATGPIGLAWLGMAMTPVATNPRPATVQRARLLVLLGAVTSLSLLAVDQQLHRNVNDPAAFTRGSELLPSDPLLASRASDLNRAVGDIDEAVRWARRRTDLEPFSAPAGARLAELLLDADRPDDAEAEIRRSLEQDAYNPTALQIALGIALATDDDELFELATDRLAELGLD